MRSGGALPGLDLDEIRKCVHCGICLPQCPTYRVLGEEMDSPRGRIYLMRAAAEGRVGLSPALRGHLDLCLGCRACETACPSGVRFGSLLEATRAELRRSGPPARHRRLEAFIFSVFPEPARLGGRRACSGGSRDWRRWRRSSRTFPARRRFPASCRRGGVREGASGSSPDAFSATSIPA